MSELGTRLSRVRLYRAPRVTQSMRVSTSAHLVLHCALTADASLAAGTPASTLCHRVALDARAATLWPKVGLEPPLLDSTEPPNRGVSNETCWLSGVSASTMLAAYEPRDGAGDRGESSGSAAGGAMVASGVAGAAAMQMTVVARSSRPMSTYC